MHYRSARAQCVLYNCDWHLCKEFDCLIHGRPEHKTCSSVPDNISVPIYPPADCGI